jgi:hypothetical protein
LLLLQTIVLRAFGHSLFGILFEKGSKSRDMLDEHLVRNAAIYAEKAEKERVSIFPFRLFMRLFYLINE